MKRKPPWATTNKYGVAPKDERTYDGVVYDSKAEKIYAEALDLREKSGDILGWVRQITVRLGSDSWTRIDFLVFIDINHTELVEIKGFETPRFKEVRRLWAKYGPGPLFIKKRKGNGWTTEVLPGKPKP